MCHRILKYSLSIPKSRHACRAFHVQSPALRRSTTPGYRNSSIQDTDVLQYCIPGLHIAAKAQKNPTATWYSVPGDSLGTEPSSLGIISRSDCNLNYAGFTEGSKYGN